MNAMPESLPRAGEHNQIATLQMDLRRRHSELEDQRRELAVLIKQAASEIETLSGRARDAGSQLRQVENNFGSFSQADIKRIYSAAQEAQMRQFMMQSQLEQLRNRLSSLESSSELLSQLIDSADMLVSNGGTGGDGSEALVGRAVSGAEQTERSHEAADAVFRGIELALGRLSRQLQDEVAQTLSDLILRAEVCERLADVDKQKARAEITRMKQAASAALKSTRQYVQELRSPALEDAGLHVALRRYVDSLRSSDKLQVEMQISGLEKELSPAASTAVFRIVQEALSNAARHSGSNQAELRLRYEPEQMAVSIVDDGQGFDVEQALQQAWSREQAGLTDMQLRAELIGGVLEISSKPGTGCVVNLAFPL